jgi:hypothetical protein
MLVVVIRNCYNIKQKLHLIGALKGLHISKEQAVVRILLAAQGLALPVKTQDQGSKSDRRSAVKG